MGVSDLCESGFVLWTEQHAEALRQVSGTNNSLDIANLAEGIAQSTIEIERSVSDLFDLNTALSDVRLRLAPQA